MRGTQKRVVYLKNTGSELFDEAYFIIKENTKRAFLETTEDDLIKEANRIINEHTREKKGRARGKLIREIGAFLIGASVSFILTVLIFK